MALQGTDTAFTENAVETVKLKNVRDSTQARYHVGTFGATGLIADFGSGTLTIGVTYDGGNTVITDISDSATTAFADHFARIFNIPSSENEPAELVLTLTGSTTPNFSVRVYNER